MKALEKFLFVLVGYGITTVPLVFIFFYIPSLFQGQDDEYDGSRMVAIVFISSLMVIGRFVSEKIYGLVHKGEKLFKKD